MTTHNCTQWQTRSTQHTSMGLAVAVFCPLIRYNSVDSQAVGQASRGEILYVRSTAHRCQGHARRAQKLRQARRQEARGIVGNTVHKHNGIGCALWTARGHTAMLPRASRLPPGIVGRGGRRYAVGCEAGNEVRCLAGNKAGMQGGMRGGIRGGMRGGKRGKILGRKQGRDTRPDARWDT